jgi:gliding motility-associated lipoprotein GldH
MKNIFFFLSFCFLLQSCGQSFLYEKDISLSNNTWTYDSQLDFPFEVTDTKSLQNLYLDITHSTEFKTQNLYVKFHTKSPSGKVISDVVSLELAEKNGVWFGNCGGEWCDLRIPIQSGAYFEELGTYTLSIEQYTRTEALKGVKSIGFRVEKTERTRK